MSLQQEEVAMDKKAKFKARGKWAAHTEAEGRWVTHILGKKTSSSYEQRSSDELTGP